MKAASLVVPLLVDLHLGPHRYSDDGLEQIEGASLMLCLTSLYNYPHLSERL